jgi:xanthine dehydrogenase small subunit
MIEFILNDRLIRTDKPQGMPLVDFIRYESGLTATKIGCREGDCGACTVMEGEYSDGSIIYKTIVSCLTPLVHAYGKHIVTVEGINCEALTPVQQAIVDHSGTQCGFCTPGFVMSLMTHCLSGDTKSLEKAIASVDGNICRCTGYKSIERAVKQIWEVNQSRNGANPIEWMVRNKYLPDYFSVIHERLSVIEKLHPTMKENAVMMGGGTDLMVQKADSLMNAEMADAQIECFRGIEIHGDICKIGSSTTVTEMVQSEALKQYFPKLDKHFKLISSTPIRNMATLAGNIVNASPIADLAIFFLALDTEIILEDQQKNHRQLPLRKFFKGYKQIDLRPGELVHSVQFCLPGKDDHFNFEKVSKRERLDIASVNTAILIIEKKGIIEKVDLSAGGIAPIPLYLTRTCEFLTGKEIKTDNLLKANEIMQTEISPISDIRGSAIYKSLLLRQLFFAHFIELSPDLIDIPELISNISADEKH